MSVLNQKRSVQLSRSSRRGFADGVASVFSLIGEGRPAPPYIRRSIGSLTQDTRALQRDSERLVHGHS
jgi:hypothetical protein